MSPRLSPSTFLRISVIHVGVVLLTAGGVWPALAQTPEALPPAAPAFEGDLSALATELEKAVQTHPDLQGGWLDVDLDDQLAVEDGPKRFVFRRVLDPRRADVQAAAMDTLMKQLVPSGRYRVDSAKDRRLPYSDLMEAMRALVATDVRFTGCKVLGGTYRFNTDGGTLDFLPRFQVARDGQFSELMGECRRITKGDPVWSEITVSEMDEDKGQKMLVPEYEPDVNQLFVKLQQAIRDEPALQGSWMDVNEDYQGHPGVAPKLYIFHRAFDGERMTAQSAAMDKLMRRLVPSGRFRVDATKDVTLPLSQLVGRLQDEIDIEPRFAGCSLSAATYAFNDDDKSFDLVLHGRVWKEKQTDLLADLCRSLMKDDPAWEAADVQLLTADRDELAVVPESPAIGARYYSEAMHHFWKMDYEAADRLLALASVEDPLNLVYRYWRVIGDLAEGDQGLAENRLKKTMDAFGVRTNSRQHVAVMREIYRIQGPLRHALIDAERKAMMSRTVRSDRTSRSATQRSAVAID
jgi:hypothetical protein